MITNWVSSSQSEAFLHSIEVGFLNLLTYFWFYSADVGMLNNHVRTLYICSWRKWSSWLSTVYEQWVKMLQAAAMLCLLLTWCHQQVENQYSSSSANTSLLVTWNHLQCCSDSDLFQSLTEQGPFDVHWRKLCSLVAAFSDAGEFQVTGRFKFNPEIYLTDAISSTYRASLTRQVFRGEVSSFLLNICWKVDLGSSTTWNNNKNEHPKSVRMGS